MNAPSVRGYRAEDFAEWVRMRSALWPEIAPEEAEPDAREWLAHEATVVLVAERADGSGLGGFVEVGEREYADSCDASPVAYLEARFVDPDLRRSGMGQRLAEAAMHWARERGYREMASDALLENAVSHRAHEAAGFVEVERAVRYRLVL